MTVPDAFVPGWVLRRDRPSLHGAMGTVYFVASPSDPAHVAVVKYPRAEALRRLRTESPSLVDDALNRFRIETRIQRLCAGPNTPTLFDHGEATFPDIPEQPVPYIVMEDCSHRVELHPDDPKQLVRFLVGTLRGVHRFSHVHGTLETPEGMLPVSGVLHRDIKADNVWLLSDGRTVFMDFGLAGPVPGARVGTPEMMAPEILQAGRTIGANTDLYSVAAMLTKLLTGAPPFPGATPADVLRSMCSTKAETLRTSLTGAVALAPWPAADREAFVGLLMHLLEREPTLRVQTAWKALEQLGRIPTVVDALGHSPTDLPPNLTAQRETALVPLLHTFAAAEPSPLLTLILSQQFEEPRESFWLRLCARWNDGTFASGERTIRVRWEQLFPDGASFIHSITPAREIHAFCAALADAYRRGDATDLARCCIVPDGMNEPLLDEALVAWIAIDRVSLDDTPPIRRLVADVARRVGRIAAAYELVRETDPDGCELLANLALQLSRPDDAGRHIDAMPPTVRRQIFLAGCALKRQDVVAMLDLTAAHVIPSGATATELCELYAIRLRSLRYFKKALDESDPKRTGIVTDIEEIRKLLSEAPFSDPSFELPTSLHLALGIIEADECNPPAVDRHFSIVTAKTPVDNVEDLFMVAESTYVLRKKQWDQTLSPPPQGDETTKAPTGAEAISQVRPEGILKLLLDAAGNAVVLGERLGNITKLKNALENYNEALATDVVHRTFRSMQLEPKALEYSISEIAQAVERVRMYDERIGLILAGAFNEHELSRRQSSWDVRFCHLASELFTNELWYSQHNEPNSKISADVLPRLRRIRTGLVQLMTTADSGDATISGVADNAYQMRMAVRGAPDTASAMQRTLDWAVRRYDADYGVIYFAEAGYPPEQAQYRCGRERKEVQENGETVLRFFDLPGEPLVSRKLREEILKYPEGKILHKHSLELIGTESVMLMDAEYYLGVPLAQRGVLLLVVGCAGTGARTFGEIDRQLLRDISEPLTHELINFELKLQNERQAAQNIRQLEEGKDKIHTFKNRLAAITEMLRRTAKYRSFADLAGIIDRTVKLQHLSEEFMQEFVPPKRPPHAYVRPASAPLARFGRSFFAPGDTTRAEFGSPRDMRLVLLERWDELSRSEDFSSFTRTTTASSATFPLVVFDKQRIDALFDNITRNARDVLYGRPGARLALTFRHRHGRARVIFTDNGPGMDQTLLDLVMEGCTTKAEGNGVGIVSMLRTMEEHRGGIVFLSKIGVGTLVELQFPLGEPRAYVPIPTEVPPDDVTDAPLIEEEPSDGVNFDPIE